MKTRQLGYSDLYLTEIGFGSWAIGGGNWEFGWGPQDDKDAVNAIRASFDLGINWIDTAAVYGLGHSEELVAEAVKGKRSDVIIATKCSLIWDDRRRIGSSLKADSVRKECEASLKRLNTDYIDLYQIHWPNDDIHIEEGWEEIGKLIEEGKVRYGGVSNFLDTHMKRAQAIHPIASLQPPYSILRRHIEEAEIDYCRDNQIGIVAYSPMQSGLLTGKFDPANLGENDWRLKSSEFLPPNLDINLEFIEKLRELSNDLDCTVAQLAVAWTLRLPEITSSIVGARRPDQIQETAKAADVKLSDDVQNQIEIWLVEREEKLKEKDGYIFAVQR